MNNEALDTLSKALEGLRDGQSVSLTSGTVQTLCDACREMLDGLPADSPVREYHAAYSQGIAGHPPQLPIVLAAGKVKALCAVAMGVSPSVVKMITPTGKTVGKPTKEIAPDTGATA